MFRASDDDGSEPEEPNSRRGLRKSKLFLLVVGSFLVAAAGVLLVLFFLNRQERIPTLTAESLTAAQKKWEASGPESYDLDVVIAGSQSGNIHVEVRDQKVTAMTRNGVTPKQQRTWDVWSVPGQFDTIAEELEMANDPDGGFPAPPGSKVIQKAQFDDQFGYPHRYHRIVLGTRLEIRWEVTKFKPVK